jgi:Ca2+-transporting ATPase
VAAVCPWHASEPSDVLARLATNSRDGLASSAIAALRARHGINALPAAPQRSTWTVFLAQFKSPLIYMLFGAAAIALALGERSDAIVIFSVVLLNAIVGAFQEGRAEQALAALRRLSAQKARVVRDGQEQEVDARDLVPGDVLMLAAGDAVTADARIVEAAALQIAEAALTGESVPVSKTRAPVAADSVLADRTSMVYAGTHVTAGRARAVVVATGASTEIGHIASLAEGHAPKPTPLERRVEQFGRYLMVLAAIIFAAFLAIGLIARVPLAEILMVGISQVVGLIPEGLPVAMTVALAVGVQRMAKRRAIVRRLSAVETLGSTTVICSDKTGTLTRNEMTVTALWLPGEGELAIGESFACDTPARQELVEAGVLCNDAYGLVGDPTEVALVKLAIKCGLVPDAVRAAHPRSAEIPFDPAIKLMATQHGSRVVLKGAAEAILPLCTDIDRAAVLAQVDAMAARALRVLAFAEVIGGEIAADAGAGAFAGRARLLGLAGQIDPPRPEAAAAVATCLTAGIRAVMVTGDHKATGLAVARELGIARPGDLALDGTELDAMSDDALATTIDQVRVFARVHPAQKLRIVEAYQKRREVVAMTGDGVNDAPALVRANVGVAMGITGTDVAKEAAKIVITDDNFGSIVAAVEEGRVVYRNIKKAVLLLMSTSFAEVLVLLIAVVLGYPPPFAAVQILWNNLVTEGVITVNLVLDPPQGDEMRQPPVSATETLITRAMWKRIALITPTITAVTLGWFIVRLRTGVPFATVRTEAFTLLAVCEWFNVLNCMSERASALQLGVLRDRWLVGGLVIGNLLQLAVIYIPVLNVTFHTVPIPLREALGIGAAASIVLWVEELRKLVVRRR